jgi:stearoyl-CoA desaturase (delta-9 desaturase)
VRTTVSSERIWKLQRDRAILFNLIPALGFLAAAARSASSSGLHASAYVPATLMYVATFIGIELGFHRCFAHRAFVPTRGLKYALAILGSAAGQGPVTYWASNHRRHHRYIDQPGDPHSPHVSAVGALRGVRGFWHAHMGWLFVRDITNTARFGRDLLRDPVLIFVNRHYVVWVLLGIAVPAALGFGLRPSLDGIVDGVLWGGFARIFIGQQFTFSINSICHLFGAQPFPIPGQSRNNAWLALPTLGGAWHHNHHAFPFSAANDFEWWQVDIGAYFVRLFAAFGLVDHVRVPSREMLNRKRERSASSWVLSTDELDDAIDGEPIGQD